MYPLKDKSIRLSMRNYFILIVCLKLYHHEIDYIHILISRGVPCSSIQCSRTGLRGRSSNGRSQSAVFERIHSSKRGISVGYQLPLFSFFPSLCRLPGTTSTSDDRRRF